MSPVELLQQVGLLKVLSGGSNELLRATTAIRVVHELHNQYSGEEQVNALQQVTLLRIADFLQKHPRASQNEIATVVEKAVADFKTGIQLLRL